MKQISLLILLLSMAITAAAETVTMEIFYLPHRPAIAVTQKIEQAVAQLDYVTIKKHSFEDPSALPLIEKYQLHDHMPVAVFINGKDRYLLAGQEIIFRNFPKGDAFVPTFEGVWSYEQLRRLVVSLGSRQ